MATPGEPQREVTVGPDDAPASRRRTVVLVAALGLGLLAVATAFAIRASSNGDSSADDPARSAAHGEEGTRGFAGIPAELPMAVVLPDAHEVSGTVARAGGGWTAAVSFETAVDRATAESAIDTALADAGYTRGRGLYDDSRMVLFYTGEDGSALTATMNGPPAGPLTIGVVRSSP